MVFEYDSVTYETKLQEDLLSPGVPSCEGCAFFDRPFSKGCEQSQEVVDCSTAGIIWVKKND